MALPALIAAMVSQGSACSTQTARPPAASGSASRLRRDAAARLPHDARWTILCLRPCRLSATVLKNRLKEGSQLGFRGCGPGCRALRWQARGSR